MHATPLPACSGCAQPVPNPGQLVTCPDSAEREWHWDCALTVLAQVTAAPQAPNVPMARDGVPVHRIARDLACDCGGSDADARSLGTARD